MILQNIFDAQKTDFIWQSPATQYRLR